MDLTNKRRLYEERGPPCYYRDSSKREMIWHPELIYEEDENKLSEADLKSRPSLPNNNNNHDFIYLKKTSPIGKYIKY